MTKVINREICPHCFQTINNRQFTMFKDLAVALYDVWQWCIRNNRSTDIKRSEIKHLFKTENVSGRFGDLKYLMEECVGGKKKGYYDFDLRKIGLFFSGKLSIPTEIIKNDTPLEEVDSHSLAQANKQGIYLPLDGNMALEDMDRFIIKTALERADNNLTAAARALGATRETLRYRVRKYNLNIVD